MTIVERFLKYVSFDTQSDDASGVTPSTAKQFVFAEYLKEELISIGMEDVELDELGYLYATLPANTDYPVPFSQYNIKLYLCEKLDSHGKEAKEEMDCTRWTTIDIT